MIHMISLNDIELKIFIELRHKLNTPIGEL